MKLNKRLFGPWVCAAGLLFRQSDNKHRANSRRVKDMVSQPNKRLGQAARGLIGTTNSKLPLLLLPPVPDSG